jgi:hypothetical protein
MKQLVSRPALFLGFVPRLAILAIVWPLSEATKDVMMRDPSSVTGMPFYLGAISSLGILLWTLAASACLFAWILVWRRLPRGTSLFLMASGLVSCIMLLDDLFLMHQSIVPHYLRVPERVVMSVDILGGATYLWLFKKEIVAGPAHLLMLAFVLFDASIAIDFHIPERVGLLMSNHVWWEDGTEFLGITSWMLYFVERSRIAVVNVIPVHIRSESANGGHGQASKSLGDGRHITIKAGQSSPSQWG